MQEPNLYPTMEDAKKTLIKSDLSQEVKQKIDEFVTEMKIQGMKDLRRRDYYYRLKKIAQWMLGKFLNPSKEDIKNVLVRLNEQGYREWTVLTYVTMLKRFYKWHLGDDETYPECIRWVKLGSKPDGDMKPDNLITKEELDALIKNSVNSRDRALFSTLYDSGVRIGELLGMKIKDIGFDEYGAILGVEGKTAKGKISFRQVRIVGNSIAYLRAWLDNHPDKNNKSAWLFCNISGGIRGRMLTYADVHSVFRKTSRRAGIGRRIYPHLFRHTRATILAGKVTEAPLESQMGWVHGSKQTRTYVHLSMRDQDNAILKAYGIKVKEEDKIKEDRPKECQRCHQLNPSDAAYCRNCWMPFSIEKALEFQEKEKEIETAVENSKVINKLAKELIKNAPEGSKVRQLKVLLETILKDEELTEEFRKELNQP